MTVYLYPSHRPANFGQYWDHYQYNFVFLIGLYHSHKSKPSDSNSFLAEFIKEVKYLTENGINYENQIVKFKLKPFIADAPAKSYILNVKGHIGYSSCTKCITEGEYINNRMCFPDINAPLRTDENFPLHTDESFHLGFCPLENISRFGIISQTPLDYMYLVCLGVVKKLIHLWTSGPLEVRPQFKKVQNISYILENLVKPYVSAEFQRIPRSLNNFKQWKAVEFRQLLMYTEPVALKSYLSPDVFLNFLLLHVAFTILCSSKLLIHLNYAKKLLQHFVTSFNILYGVHHIFHNVHGLIRFANYVELYEPLDSFSAFRFENYMQQIKKLVRKDDVPLEQVVRRHIEIEKLEQKTSIFSTTFNNPLLIQPHKKGPLLPGCSTPQYLKYKFYNFIIVAKNKNNKCCLLSSGEIVIVENIVYYSNQNCYVIIGRQCLKQQNLFLEPCSSSVLGIYRVNELSVLNMAHRYYSSKKVFLQNS